MMRTWFVPGVLAVVWWAMVGCSDSSSKKRAAPAQSSERSAAARSVPSVKPTAGPAAGPARLQPTRAHTPTLDQAIETLRQRERIASIAVVVMGGGKLLVARGYGVADRRTGARATTDTIYPLASCSKPVVGLLIALMATGQGAPLALDRDVNDYLRWPERLVHPDFADEAVTLRQLAHHRSGLAGDTPFFYDSYPKPDPDQPLDGFMRGFALDPAYWLAHGPGQEVAYSNLGAALAGLVIEKAAGQPFNEVSERKLFTPLSLADTRWLYREFSETQRARIARPHDEDGTPLEHYGFNDYPSGLLRASARDLGTLLLVLSSGGMLAGKQVLDREAVALFHRERLFIEAQEEDGEMVYTHDGGEIGVATHLSYSLRGDGIAYLINSDLDDARLERVQEAMEGILMDELARE